MTMPIKDITDTLATISSYYKSHVGIDLDMEMSIDNDDVMAIDCAIKALEELQAHIEAWEKLKDDVVAYRNNFDYCTAMHFLNIIDNRMSEIGRKVMQNDKRRSNSGYQR